jgi:hypothetical protein
MSEDEDSGSLRRWDQAAEEEKNPAISHPYWSCPMELPMFSAKHGDIF